nr:MULTISPECIES: hypothetical protein [unclassified Pseudomonas]
MSQSTEHVGIRSTVTGDLKTVSARLNAEKAAQVVAITMDHASDETLAALGEALEATARLMTDAMLGLCRDKAKIRTFVLQDIELKGNLLSS